MSAHKHTPGPWKVLNARKEDWLGRPLEYWTVTADDGDKWLCASPEWDPEHEAESEANARLIAAAPELLEAIVLALPYVTDAEGFPEQFKPGVVARHVAQIRAAIAKATGEPA